MRVSADPARILLVDDEPDVLESVAELLQSFLGARVEQASNGDEALRMLKDHRIDLIVTDYKMPGMDGLQLLSQAERIAPGTPNIMLTAYGTEGLKALGAAGGRPHRVMDKPFDLDAFLGAVGQALSGGVHA